MPHIPFTEGTGDIRLNVFAVNFSQGLSHFFDGGGFAGANVENLVIRFRVIHGFNAGAGDIFD